ncbi:MAG: DUF1549 domain-containing protein [Roseibacillus sp.]|nr:DUF1549 domain-containing protein [Roseibacillus sp.]
MQPLLRLSLLAVALAPALTCFAEKAGPHWAFEELKRPPDQWPDNQRWARNGVDFFIQDAHRETGLHPNPEADKLTLIRRLTLDLTGLPPTLAELDSFIADESENAYQTLVDRLLASPHYGERWGRHWLDVARYVQGKTKVAAVDRIDMAEPYRDYVVRAFNADKPYNQFVTEQLAGDLLPAPADRQAYLDQIAAPGFLSIGPWFADCADPNSLRMDIIDEQMSTVTQAFLGLNFGCARCHDHKFDPIPTRDYYAMAGIFGSTRILQRNSTNWRDGRYRLTRHQATPKQISDDKRMRKIIANLRADRWDLMHEIRAQLIATTTSRLAAYDRALKSLPVMPAVQIEAEDYNGQNNVRRAEFEDGMVVETQRERLQWVGWRPKLPEAGTYTVFLRCAAPESYLVELKLDGKSVLKDHALPATGGWEARHFRWVSLGHFQFRKGTNDVRLWAQDHSYLPRIDKLRFARTPPHRGKWLNEAIKRDQLDKQVLSQLQFIRKPWPPNIADAERFLASPNKSLHELDGEIAKLQERYPALPRMLSVTEQPTMVNEPIHRSGDVYNLEQEAVARAVPTLAEGLVKSPDIPAQASGRLELAHWITDPNNPLTARVMVNRLWQGHFGTGLVATPGDFGIQGARPTNQNLLDWLAVELIEGKWSLKKIHRLIVHSATYRQSSTRSKSKAALDPDNNLYWSFPRRRLEAEALYDSMLSIAGKVPRQPSGQPLDHNKSMDRAMYILTSGRSPLGMGIEIRKMLHLFGYDPSGVPVHHRDHTATAAQSLFWLNNKLPSYYATKLAEHLLALPDLNDEQRVIIAYRMTIGRLPAPNLMERTFTYLDHCRIVQDLGETESWTRVCLALFSSDSFSHLE